MGEELLNSGASVGAVVTGGPGVWRGRGEVMRALHLTENPWFRGIPWVRNLPPGLRLSPFDRSPVGSAGFS